MHIIYIYIYIYIYILYIILCIVREKKRKNIGRFMCRKMLYFVFIYIYIYKLYKAPYFHFDLNFSQRRFFDFFSPNSS